MESENFYDPANFQSDLNSLDGEGSIATSDSIGVEAIVGNFDTKFVRESILKYKICKSAGNIYTLLRHH